MIKRAFANWALFQVSNGRMAFWGVTLAIVGLVIPASTYDPHAPQQVCDMVTLHDDSNQNAIGMLKAQGWDTETVNGKRVLIEPGCTP
jgi:hypothetical protein